MGAAGGRADAPRTCDRFGSLCPLSASVAPSMSAPTGSRAESAAVDPSAPAFGAVVCSSGVTIPLRVLHRVLRERFPTGLGVAFVVEPARRLRVEVACSHAPAMVRC